MNIKLNINILHRLIDIIQRGIIRSIRRVDRRTSAEPLFREFKLLNMDMVHHYIISPYLYRTLRKLLVIVLFTNHIVSLEIMYVWVVAL